MGYVAGFMGSNPEDTPIESTIQTEPSEQPQFTKFKKK